MRTQYGAFSTPPGYGLEAEGGKKEAEKSVVRVAEQPGQTINVDLLFIPEHHEAEERLPAVSGSSGHLVVGRTTAEKEAPYWPGLAFANNELTYEEAMRQYISETRDRLEHRKRAKETKKGDDSTGYEEWQARSDRYQLRKQRKQQDADWKIAKTERQAKFLAFQALPRHRIASYNDLSMSKPKRVGMPAVNKDKKPGNNENRKTKSGISATSKEKRAHFLSELGLPSC